MRIARVFLKSVSPYSQSRYYKAQTLDKESKGDYEARTWRDRCNVDDNGFIVIPPMAFKNCLSAIAKYLGLQIPGKGKKTYTKHFEAGVLITDSLKLTIKKEDVKGEWFFVPADGVRGSGKRVEKCFPVIPSWEGEVKVFILDNTITEEVFQLHIEEAGKYIGIGRFRPQNNGFYGRFDIVKIIWETK